MYEPPKSKHLPGNPFAGVAQAQDNLTHAVLALAWEIRTQTMLNHPHVGHDVTKERLNEC